MCSCSSCSRRSPRPSPRPFPGRARVARGRSPNRSANVVASTRNSRRIYDFGLGNRTIHPPNSSPDHCSRATTERHRTPLPCCLRRRLCIVALDESPQAYALVLNPLLIDPVQYRSGLRARPPRIAQPSSQPRHPHLHCRGVPTLLRVRDLPALALNSAYRMIRLFVRPPRHQFAPANKCI